MTTTTQPHKYTISCAAAPHSRDIEREREMWYTSKAERVHNLKMGCCTTNGARVGQMCLCVVRQKANGSYLPFGLSSLCYIQNCIYIFFLLYNRVVRCGGGGGGISEIELNIRTSLRIDYKICSVMAAFDDDDITISIQTPTHTHTTRVHEYYIGASQNATSYTKN